MKSFIRDVIATASKPLRHVTISLGSSKSHPAKDAISLPFSSGCVSKAQEARGDPDDPIPLANRPLVIQSTGADPAFELGGGVKLARGL